MPLWTDNAWQLQRVLIVNTLLDARRGLVEPFDIDVKPGPSTTRTSPQLLIVQLQSVPG